MVVFCLEVFIAFLSLDDSRCVFLLGMKLFLSLGTDNGLASVRLVAVLAFRIAGDGGGRGSCTVSL